VLNCIYLAAAELKHRNEPEEKGVMGIRKKARADTTKERDKVHPKVEAGPGITGGHRCLDKLCTWRESPFLSSVKGKTMQK